MVHVTNWNKFKLLLWKNWLLQWNQKWQILIELLLPPIFGLILVFVRSKVVAESKTVTHFRTLYIQNLNMFRIIMENSQPINLTLCYSPLNPLLEKIVQETANFLHLPGVQGYKNAEILQNDLVFGKYICGIQFDDNWHNITKYPKNFSFALRFPSELRTALPPTTPMNWLTTKLFLPMGYVGPRNIGCDDDCLPVGYLREGFLPIQHVLSMSYIKLLTNNNALPYVDLQRFPYPEYVYDPLMLGLKSSMSLIILLSFIYPCTYIVKHITAEKEKQLKEVMKIMGLNNWIHWTAWFFKSFIMMTISSILMTIILKIRWKNNVAVFTHVQGSILLFFLLVYVLTSICFCFLISTFFSKASTAAAITGLIWFIAYMPFTVYMETYDDLSLFAKLGWCLVSNTALGFGFKLIIEYEGKGGLQWHDLFSPVNIDDNLTVGYIVIMMLISCVLYLCICLYVEQIFPGDYGVPKKWNYIFNKQFWNKQKYINKDVEDVTNGFREQKNPDAFEPEPLDKNLGLQIKNLEKQFGLRMAVKGLSLNMYENEITVLLGHNGAGKTTTISMLTGLIPPSSGTAIINGYDIRTNTEGARLSLGICPQHNVLFDDLTVAEHLIFFSRLKGLKGEEVKREVDKFVSMIQLENKANVASKKLSGGMKRKLSICCALTGNTKVVLCDEPSSGMDPSARRQLWDLLLREKRGRTILLTTHYMDEADVLGDRIAIMCEGELKCYGTSFFLKKKYGSGYRLICVKRDDCNTRRVTALLQKYIPDLEPGADIGAELYYQLPDNYSNIFEEMLGDLEEQSDDLKLNGYGIGITSLEEVFLKMGAEKINDLPQGSDLVNANHKNISTDLLYSKNTSLLKGFKLWSNQWHTMFLKKFLYTYSNKLLFLIQNIMPIFIVSSTILISRSQETFKTLPPLTMTLNQYPEAVTVLETASLLRPNSIHYKIAKKYKSLISSYGSNYELVDIGNKNFSDYILALGQQIQVRINAKYLVAATVGINKITAWFNNQPLHTAPLAVNLIHNAMIKAYKGDSYHITVTNYPLPYSSKARFAHLNTANNLGTQLSTNICFCFCFVSAFYILLLIKERECRAKLLQFVSGVRVWIFWFSHLIWDFFTLTITIIVVIFTIAYWQEKGLASAEELVAARYFLMLVLFGCSVLPFTYLLSFYFTEPATGFARISIINILSGMAMFIVDLVMSLEIFNTKDTAEFLDWFFRIFPHFSLAKGLNKLYINVATRDSCSAAAILALDDDLKCDLVPKCCKSVPYFAWQEPGILPEILYMSSTSIIFFLIIIIREYNLISALLNKIKQKMFKPAVPPTKDGYNEEDVEKEKNYVMEMTKSELNSMNLVLDRVTKYYGKFLAVNQISLSVKAGECFGLLGVNGAGKSSTFKIMIGDERITFGKAYVKGLNLASDINKIYKETGYCPQFDALLDDLTGREILKIFCLLRGIHRSLIHDITEEFAKSFGFTKYLDKKIKRFSGGNKRKLSSALAVIGSPSVIYLDEPTTSMDPLARRHLWNIICHIRDSGKSIILTSHSMEECEALCTRLAIMVNGEFKCIGSTQHLKNKFSKGLILKIKVKRQENLETTNDSLGANNEQMFSTAEILHRNISNIKLFVVSEFPQAILQEEYESILTFYIPFNGIKWSQIFGLIERNRVDLHIEDYTISQTNLEEIFLEFAKYQREDPRENK